MLHRQLVVTSKKENPMIRLHAFGPAFGLVDPSPFAMKVHGLLRLAKLPYERIRGDVQKAPKHKLPVLEDDGAIVPDSTLIRMHIERKYGFDFDANLSPAERGAAWAFEKMCEDHLYFALVFERWTVDANFFRGPVVFFERIPRPMRSFVVSMVRKRVRKTLYAQGFSRYDEAERLAIVGRAFRALSDYLSTREFIGGSAPCGADASAFATLSCFFCPHFEGPFRREVEKHPVLADYVTRVRAALFADQA
jgi:glutathione S-transferase